MNKIYIGIDNGVTGSIGIVSDLGQGLNFFKTPVKEEQDYQKKYKTITRIDRPEFLEVMKKYKEIGFPLLVIIERPLKNNIRLDATCSGMRAHESMLVTIEELEIPFRIIDSKEWQLSLLPKDTKGSVALKKASKDVGKRLFPDLQLKHPDCDGILIAEYARLKQW